MTIIELKTPPSPRKSPQQSRSRHMVEIILDSCKKVLVEHGESALTLAVLERVSGVSTGSIYQYYPSLNAIIAALFEREFLVFSKKGKQTVEEMDCHNPEVLIRFLIDDAVAWHATMCQLHSSFYDEYRLYYDGSMRFKELYCQEDFSREYIVKAIQAKYGYRHSKDIDELAHLLLLTLTNMFFSALKYYPKKINDPRYQRQMLRACLAMIEEYYQH